MSIDVLKEHFAALSEDWQEEAISFITHLSELQAKKAKEEDFWKLINKIDWNADGDYKAALPLDEVLSKSSDDFIYSFQDFLAEKLSDLDGPVFHGIAAKGLSGSSDAFLYARCYVVAKGADYYYHTLLNPQEFPDEWFEAILHAPDRAYEQKNGKDLNRTSSTDYETGCNPALWGEEYVAAKLAMFKA